MKLTGIVLGVLLLLTNGKCEAKYFHFADLGNLRQGAAVLYDPHNAGTAGVTDIAVVVPSTTDGNFLPDFADNFAPAGSVWPFALGSGGSFAGDFILTASASYNVAPAAGAFILQNVDKSSSKWLQAVKSAMLGQGNSGQVRLEYALAGTAVRQGRWQSFKEALPGAGVIDILNRASRIGAGWAWTWGGK